MRKWLALFALVGADYGSKSWLFLQLPLQTRWPLLPGLSLFCCHNTGMAWSFGAKSPGLVTVTGVLLLSIFAYQLMRNSSWAMVLIVAGGLGNIIDRLLYGAVRDFILLSYGAFSWPVFNLADCYLTLGAFFLLIDMVRPTPLPKSSF